MSDADDDAQVKEVVEGNDDIRDQNEEKETGGDQKDRDIADADAEDNGSKEEEGRDERDRNGGDRERERDHDQDRGRDRGERGGDRGRGDGGNDGGEGSTSLLVRNLSFNIRFVLWVSLQNAAT